MLDQYERQLATIGDVALCPYVDRPQLLGRRGNHRRKKASRGRDAFGLSHGETP